MKGGIYMNFFEELTVKVKKGAKTAVKASGDVANFTKNKMLLADLKDQIREKEMKIGHIVYCKSKEIECEYDGEDVEILCGEIESLKGKIADVELEINEFKNAKICENCGEASNKNNDYCPKCGHKF